MQYTPRTTTSLTDRVVPKLLEFPVIVVRINLKLKLIYTIQF